MYIKEYPCPTKEKTVYLQSEDIIANTLDNLHSIPGRIDCTENLKGKCYEFVNCPLNKR